ncbi:MAG: LegC family aminotransferase [Betaproteobacteria bacterium]|nr:LegC family aminotransferase [Betaproteobacteria bacterium]
MGAPNPDAVIAALRTVLPGKQGNIALHEPWFIGKEWEYVKDCLDTGWVSSNGKYVDRFEVQLAEYTGARHAIAVVNGTAALHVCLKLAGVQPGEEVVIPALTFIATANAVSYCGATPHFADSANATLGLDPAKLSDYLGDTAEVRGGTCVNRKTGATIRAAVPMHTFGHPMEIENLLEVAARFKLVVIEDAAESLGSFYKDSHTGIFGRVSALSFNGNKVVTTGGGGAVLTNDDALAKYARHLTTTARLPHKWSFVHDEVGYNYRLPNINAALGCAQLEQLPEFVRRKRELAAAYRSAFSGVRGVRFFTEPPHARSNYWLNALVLDAAVSDRRDQLLDTLNAQGIMARPVWTLMHRLPMYQSCPRMPLDTAEDLERRLINIPSSPFLAAGKQ